jgi:Protein of unknown function DUF262
VKSSGSFSCRAISEDTAWGREEVTRLLDDISESSGRKYFLQPVVVKLRDDGKWELVDGQQRLTTLLLILRYINEHLPTVRPKYSLEYETRPGSADYLDHPAAEQSQDNIDFFHIFGAFSRIREWFESHDDVISPGILAGGVRGSASSCSTVWPVGASRCAIGLVAVASVTNVTW